MAAMRRFTCYDCNHTFEVPYGTGGSGRTMECPECGGRNIHRAEGDRGFERGAGRGGPRRREPAARCPEAVPAAAVDRAAWAGDEADRAGARGGPRENQPDRGS